MSSLDEKKGFNTGSANTRQSTWENAWSDANNERAVMVMEFNAWLVKTRIETEKYMMVSERHQRNIAPFAQAGLDNSKMPADVPLCVLEFAHETLRLLDYKRKLALLNVYYRQASWNECSESLNIEEGNEAEVLDLWEWFIEERKGGAA